MNLLVLGGTVFLGRHLAVAALEAGHRVTLFHRGRHPLDAQVRGDDRLEVVNGDRRRDLAALDGRSWDAVLDTSGYVPSEVAAAANRLGPRIDRYVFVAVAWQKVRVDFVARFPGGTVHAHGEGKIGSSPEQGSSSIISCGSAASATASPTWRCSP